MKNLSPASFGGIIEEVFAVVKSRINFPKEKSYVSNLTRGGLDAILKKIGEESTELILASKTSKSDSVVSEATDLIFHILVLLAYKGIELSDIADEFAKRRRHAKSSHS